MGYKIIAKVEDQRGLVGYQLKAPNGKTLLADRDLIIKLANRNDIDNVKYNQKIRQIVSSNNAQSLKNLKIIKLQDCFNYINNHANGLDSTSSNQTQQKPSQAQVNVAGQAQNNSDTGEKQKKVLTRVEAAKEYLKTDDNFRFDLWAPDYVKLEYVRHTNQNDEIIIPQFVKEVNWGAFNYMKHNKNLGFHGERAVVIIKGQDKEYGTIDLTDSMQFLQCENIEIIIEDASKILQMKQLFIRSLYARTIKITVLKGQFSNLKSDGLVEMCMDCKELRSFTFVNKQGDKADYSTTFNLCGMFSGCENLKNINISGLSGILSATGQLESTFEKCKSLNYIGLRAVTNRIRNLYSTFYGCQSLIQIDLDGIDNRAELTSIGGIVDCCFKLSNFNTRNDRIERLVHNTADNMNIRYIGRETRDVFGYNKQS